MQVRRLLLPLLLLSSFVFAGCPATVIKPTTACVQAHSKTYCDVQASIDNANAGIAAVSEQAVVSRADGVLTQAQEVKFYNDMVKASGYVDLAQTALAAGNVNGANDNIALANGLISAAKALLASLKPPVKTNQIEEIPAWVA